MPRREKSGGKLWKDKIFSVFLDGLSNKNDYEKVFGRNGRHDGARADGVRQRGFQRWVRHARTGFDGGGGLRPFGRGPVRGGVPVRRRVEAGGRGTLVNGVRRVSGGQSVQLSGKSLSLHYKRKIVTYGGYFERFLSTLTEK